MTAMTDVDAWRRLGALLIQRRTALNPRFHNRGAFCDATGLKYRLVYDVEEARRSNFGASTLAAIEAAYRLTPGAIGRFLAGGELEAQDAQPLPSRSWRPPRPPLPPTTSRMSASCSQASTGSESRHAPSSTASWGSSGSSRPA